MSVSADGILRSLHPFLKKNLPRVDIVSSERYLLLYLLWHAANKVKVSTNCRQSALANSKRGRHSSATVTTD